MYFKYIYSLSLLIVFIILFPNNLQLKRMRVLIFPQENYIVIDSELTLDQALLDLQIPENIKSTLAIINIDYYGFDSLTHRGQLVISDKLKTEVIEIFDSLKKIKYPIEKIIPIVNYSWSDSLSMADNNTSCFNYRNIKGYQLLSDHAYGKAIDINPIQNPFISYKTRVSQPFQAEYDTAIQGTILKNSIVVNLFKEKGWKWGGDWKYSKDYQHFYKK